MGRYNLTSFTMSFVESDFLATTAEEDRDDITSQERDVQISQNGCFSRDGGLSSRPSQSTKSFVDAKRGSIVCNQVGEPCGSLDN